MHKYPRTAHSTKASFITLCESHGVTPAEVKVGRKEITYIAPWWHHKGLMDILKTFQCPNTGDDLILKRAGKKPGRWECEVTRASLKSHHKKGDIIVVNIYGDSQ